MNGLIVYRANARSDLLEIAVFFAQKSLAVSDRFLASVEDAVEQLRRMPGLGEIVETGNPQFTGLRCRPVPGFKNYTQFTSRTRVFL